MRVVGDLNVIWAQEVNLFLKLIIFLGGEVGLGATLKR